MDKEKFAEAVRAAEFIMACSAYNGKTSGAAHAMALITHSRDGDGLEENLICLSRSERWAWDAVSAMTQAALRHPYQPISPVLATWAADMLAGNEPRPRVKGKRLVNRDLAHRRYNSCALQALWSEADTKPLWASGMLR